MQFIHNIQQNVTENAFCKTSSILFKLQWVAYCHCLPIANSPFLFTILWQMASPSTYRTEDGVRDDRLRLLDLLQFAQSIVFPQRSIQLSQLTQLLTTQVILTLRDFNALTDDLIDFVDSFLHIIWVASSDVGMERFILTRQRLAILATNFTLLHGTLASDNDLSSRLEKKWI